MYSCREKVNPSEVFQILGTDLGWVNSKDRRVAHILRVTFVGRSFAWQSALRFGLSPSTPPNLCASLAVPSDARDAGRVIRMLDPRSVQ